MLGTSDPQAFVSNGSERIFQFVNLNNVMPLCDFSTTTIDFPKIMESVAVEQLQLEYRLGDIDRKEYVTRTNIEKDVRIFFPYF